MVLGVRTNHTTRVLEFVHRQNKLGIDADADDPFDFWVWDDRTIYTMRFLAFPETLLF
jgi:hypothetical protein